MQVSSDAAALGPRVPAVLRSLASPLRDRFKAAITDPPQLYARAIGALGMLVIAHSLWQLVVDPVHTSWLLLVTFTVVSGAASLRMPHIPVSFSISDTFTIAAALLFGPAAGALTVAIDSLVISLSLKAGGFHRVLFNAAAPAFAMWVAAHALFAWIGPEPLIAKPRTMVTLLAPLAAFTALYFILNSVLVAMAVTLEKGGTLFAIWRQHFLGLWLTHFGGAAIATIVVVLVSSHGANWVVLALVAPVPLILYFTFKATVGRMEDHLGHLQQVNRMHLATIEALAHAIDAKDQVTHGHIRRVQQYAVNLARALGVTDDVQLRAIEAASLLHDLGKLAIPEHILNKPGKLTQAEFQNMRRHAAIGADILAGIDFPYPVVPIVRHHHEHWDGRGYPDGIRGDAIPIGARILSVVDCFDALTSDRPYRPRLSTGEALSHLRERSGTAYDPAVVNRFVEIAESLIEAPPPPSAALTAIAQALNYDKVAGPRLRDAYIPEVLAAFWDLGAEISGALNAADAVNRAHRVLTRLLPVACTAVFRYDPANDEVVADCVAGQHAAALQGLRIPLGQRLSGWVAANRSTIVNSDATLDLGNLAMTLTPTPHACLSTPVCIGAELVAVLTVYSTHMGGFTQAHSTIVEAVASRLANTLQADLAPTRAAKKR